MTSGSAALTIDNDDSTYYERKDSAGCPPCGAGATVTATYTLSVATQVESVTIVGYQTSNRLNGTPVVLTFADGSTQAVVAEVPGGDFTLVVPGPWANVASVKVTLTYSSGSQSGGGGWVKLKETRIKAAGVLRLPKCN